MIIPIPLFLRPSFYSAKKVAAAASNAKYCKEEDELDEISRTYRHRVIGNDGEDDESHKSVQCVGAENCLTLIRKQQREVVPAAVVAPCVGVNSVIHSVTSFATELQRTQRVRFIDETFDIEAPHIVTETHYRPETTEEEKALLYYCPEEYAKFALDHWRWKLSEEIKRLQELQAEEKESRSRYEEEKKDAPISRVRRHHDLVCESNCNYYR
ncbi:hypothetical protein QTG54_002802 [Skeletonema marinoi]|uniref:Uncharacterized protein n=1 Tax=Skeletonema marinoi TaxID=267567 RepID=A0AAD8YJH0_9STRA|nr:hypothetical protein QTG54_002802 [Skeletonema marinoi]